jgi:hypothetical protein
MHFFYKNIEYIFKCDQGDVEGGVPSHSVPICSWSRRPKRRGRPPLLIREFFAVAAACDGVTSLSRTSPARFSRRLRAYRRNGEGRRRLSVDLRLAADSGTAVITDEREVNRQQIKKVRASPEAKIRAIYAG